MEAHSLTCPMPALTGLSITVCVTSGDSGFLSMAASAGGTSVEPQGERLREGSASSTAVRPTSAVAQLLLDTGEAPSHWNWAAAWQDREVTLQKSAGWKALW